MTKKMPEMQPLQKQQLGEKLLGHITPEVLNILRTRNILSSEDPAVYDALLESALKLFPVGDDVQCINVKKLHDIQWEILRIMRFKPKIMDAARKDGLHALLRCISDKSYIDNGGFDEAAKDATEFYENPEGRKIIVAKLAKHNLDLEAIDALAFQMRLVPLGVIEKLLATLEARAYALLEQIEIHALREHRQFALSLEQMTVRANSRL